MALVRVGDLLLPVWAPVAGTVLAAAMPEGSLVGFGDPLLALLPEA